MTATPEDTGTGKGGRGAPLIVGVDAGTSVIKAVAFTADGHQVAIAERRNSYIPLPGGGVEQDMARTWADTAATLRELVESVPGLTTRIAALAVTAQGDGTWLIDADGAPVGDALLWLDARAAGVTEAMIARPDYPSLYAISATGATACQQASQLAWLKRAQPERLARAATAFHCKDWLYFRLTGERVTDTSEGVFTFGDYRTRRYAPEILDAYDLADRADLLPPMVEGTTTAGALSDAAAGETGLPPGLPVVLGHLDVVCTALGGGLYDPAGKVGCSIVGSTGMHMRLATSPDKVRLNPDCSGFTIPFPVPGMSAQNQSNMAATINIDWLLDLARGVLADAGVDTSRGDLLSGADARVMGAVPGRLLYHPYISTAGERGPILEPAARASFLGLEADHGYVDLLRAVYEGLAYAARDCYAAMGGVPSEIRMAGGAARSSAIRAILAAMLGASVRRCEQAEAGAAGAAMMAAVQQGLYRDMASCAADWVDRRLTPLEEPDAALAAIYDRRFPVYRHAREALRPIWRAWQDAARQDAVPPEGA